jgi:antitoxin ParD1/3/4
MAKTTSIALGEHFDSFISQQLEGGRYGSASEVVREALRLLENREMRLAALREALIKGEQSGFVDDFDLESLNADIDRELNQS